MRRKNKWCLGIIIFIIIAFLIISMAKKESVKESNLAGTWYSASKLDLNKAVESYLKNADKKVDKKINGLIVPHAGYEYSGQVAAYGFKQLNNDYKTVILMAPSHHVRFDGAAVLNVSYFKTPLGKVKVSKKVEKLLKEDSIYEMPEVYAEEHSLEIQLPFLQKTLSNFELVPLITGDVNPSELAKTLEKYIDDKTLIIASSDLSHYHSYNEAVRLDNECVKNIEEINVEKVGNCEMCGVMPVLVLMNIAKNLNWKSQIIKYENSGDVTGDKSKVVGYSSIVFFEKDENLNKEEKNILLKLAREKLESIFTKKEVKVSKLSDKLKEKKGCFVTLTENDELRGCIGNIDAREELYKCVLNNAINAALYDPRFNQVSEDELEDIKIEISVLTNPVKLEFKDAEDLLKKLRQGIDGVILKKNGREATFLPQVWEQIDNKEEFLMHLSLKAGLNENAWKDKDIEIYIYEVENFSE